MLTADDLANIDYFLMKCELSVHETTNNKVLAKELRRTIHEELSKIPIKIKGG